MEEEEEEEELFIIHVLLGKQFGEVRLGSRHPALKAPKDRSMTKNVAEEIAEKPCESMAASLEGKKLASFTRISSTVHAAMEEAPVRI
ncbi:Signal recognition particle receptor subunit alpha isogeny [Arachis hypogaea]|nr:Signal recognition particle receptor subunit alpha isogeny [Arachis hypogaea]